MNNYTANDVATLAIGAPARKKVRELCGIGNSTNFPGALTGLCCLDTRRLCTETSPKNDTPILDKNVQKCHCFSVLSDKLEQLRDVLRSYGSCLVAYSGGVDSAFLARIASDVLGNRSLAAIADSPSLPRRELDAALAVADKFNFQVRVVRTAEFENPDYLANPINRCYFCKHELFNELVPIARTEGYAVIAYGENASDVGDSRPGSQAAAEFEVRAPLKEVGLTKSEIRELSAQIGLPTADKPQMACLSSRIPHGEPVTQEKLHMIEAAENLLRDLGFYDVRVRHHELKFEGQHSKTGSAKYLARIEVGPTELQRFLENGISERVAETLEQIGYSHITLDLRGYRRGNANAPLSSHNTL